jgi:hypothetical protein
MVFGFRECLETNIEVWNQTGDDGSNIHSDNSIGKFTSYGLGDTGLIFGTYRIFRLATNSRSELGPIHSLTQQ